jgi:hypothetical protein
MCGGGEASAIETSSEYIWMCGGGSVMGGGMKDAAVRAEKRGRGTKVN